jgi:hypothetical protein
MNSAIAQRMKDTGFSYEQVMQELAMMQAAKERFESGKLTAEDRQEIARCRRHWQPQGRGR